MDAWNGTYGLLLAGGKGTRFWPLSREDHPKQLLRLFSDRSLVEETYLRILPAIPSERLFVATSETLATRLMALLPQIPSENFILEPVPKNTAPCIAVACVRLQKRDPCAVLVVLPSDHYVSNTQAFLDVLGKAVNIARKGRIATLGITPTHPETGYGYIKFGDTAEAAGDESGACRMVEAFIEKPSVEAATVFLREGSYLWNSGIFVFRTDVLLEKVKLHLSELFEAVKELEKAEEEGAPNEKIAEIWNKMPDISIDYGIMEKASGLVVVPAAFGWSDVGSWRALASFPTDENGNFVHGRVLQIDAHGNVLYSSHGFLAVIGLKNTVVVVTRGATLVCPLDRTQEVKELVAKLKSLGYDELL